jgi:hypothetical protein
MCTPDRLTLTVSALITEIDEALADDHWVLLVSRTRQGQIYMSDKAVVRLYAAAGLRHCCVLVADIDRARVEGRETLARLAARAHLETWLTATYIQRGGFEALAAVDGSYQQSLLNWQHANATYNDQLQAQVRRIKRERTSIRKNNQHRQRHNDSLPDWEPLPMLPLPPLPTRTTNTIDVTPALADLTKAKPADLPLTEIVQRLNRLVVNAQEPDPALENVYDYAYRFFSNFGAHPTLPVLDSYIKDKDRNFVRLARTQLVPPMAETLTEHALMFTAALAQLVLGSQDQTLPVTDAFLADVMARLEEGTAT